MKRVKLPENTEEKYGPCAYDTAAKDRLRNEIMKQVREEMIEVRKEISSSEK